MKLHPWFAGVDWPSLARQKVAFVPQPDHETDTSYFSSKPVSQRSLALDLNSSRSELMEAAAAAYGGAGASAAASVPLSPAGSLHSSRSHSRAGSKRVSTRRRSLRQALAEPSGASWSELRGMRATLSHSSGSATSRTSLSGAPDAALGMTVQPSAGSVVRSAADLLRRELPGGGSPGLPRRRWQEQQGSARGSVALSSDDLPAGEPRGPLSADDEEAAQGAAARGSTVGDADMGDTAEADPAAAMEEEDDGASASGSSGGTPLGSGEYSSAHGGGGAEELSSEASSGGSGARTPHFRGFSFKNLGMLAEQNLEALRWVKHIDVRGAGMWAGGRDGMPGRRMGILGADRNLEACAGLRGRLGVDQSACACRKLVVHSSSGLQRLACCRPHPPYGHGAPSLPAHHPAETSMRMSLVNLIALQTWQRCARSRPRLNACPARCRPLRPSEACARCGGGWRRACVGLAACAPRSPTTCALLFISFCPQLASIPPPDARPMRLARSTLPP